MATLNVDGGYDWLNWNERMLGISECDALIAQTGTVLVVPGLPADGRCQSCRRIMW